MMAVTKNELIPQQTFSVTACQLHCPQHSVHCPCISTAFETSRFVDDNIFNRSNIILNNCSNRTECLQRNVQTTPKLDQYKMNIMSCNESPIIDTINDRNKYIGSFTTSLLNSRNQASDSRNNNLETINQSPTDMEVVEAMKEARVPVNGEPTTDITAYQKSTAACKPPIQHVGQSTCRTDSGNLARKSSLQSNLNAVSLLKLRDYVYIDNWKDDSLSLSSSFSSMSSLPSLPSPPSPVSPPSYRPQSVPQTTENTASEGDILSACIQDPTTLLTATYSSNSCGGSPRKRIKDSEGFIRRAACICVNDSETEVRNL